jgi:hypothetical protein
MAVEVCNISKIILTCRGIVRDLKDGFWIEVIDILYIHTSREYRQLQRYRYSKHFPVHRSIRTRILSLH